MADKREQTEKVVVAEVRCDKCESKTFKLYRKMKDKINFFLVCAECGFTKEFRVFLVWESNVELNPLPEGDTSFYKELYDMESNKCSRCGGSNPPDARKCDKCGNCLT